MTASLRLVVASDTIAPVAAKRAKTTRSKADTRTVSTRIDTWNEGRYPEVPPDEWRHDLQLVTAKMRGLTGAPKRLAYLVDAIARHAGDGCDLQTLDNLATWLQLAGARPEIMVEHGSATHTGDPVVALLEYASRVLYMAERAAEGTAVDLDVFHVGLHERKTERGTEEAEHFFRFAQHCMDLVARFPDAMNDAKTAATITALAAAKLPPNYRRRVTARDVHDAAEAWARGPGKPSRRAAAEPLEEKWAKLARVAQAVGFPPSEGEQWRDRDKKRRRATR